MLPPLHNLRPGAFSLSAKWSEKANALPETGMGYTVVSVVLHDGRTFRQVVIDSGFVARVRGLPDVPFTERDIADFEANHEKWDWAEVPYQALQQS